MAGKTAAAVAAGENGQVGVGKEVGGTWFQVPPVTPQHLPWDQPSSCSAWVTGVDLVASPNPIHPFIQPVIHSGSIY